MSRPNFLKSLGLLPAGPALIGNSKAASARGLVQFPCPDGLMNTYHIMRAGQSLLEEEDVWSTNPLFLTNRECALSQLGIGQVEATCRALNEGAVTPTLVRYSLAANAMDTANIVGRDLKIGRDRLVPEFFFLDPRAVGLWDTSPLTATEGAVWAMDADEAGPDGTAGRPPPNEDGTPHETLSDQVPRLRQLLSALETQFSGDTVLLIFPDGTGPALLTALIGGIPLNRVHELNYRSGEVRLDVKYDTARAMLSEEPTATYRDRIERGRAELRRLRANPDGIVSVKDKKYEEEIRADEALAAERAEATAAKEEAERKARKDKEEADRRARKETALKLEEEKRQKRDAAAAAAGSGDVDTSPIVTSLVALGALGAGSFAFGNKEEDGTSKESVILGAGNQTIATVGNGLNVTAIATEDNGNVTAIVTEGNGNVAADVEDDEAPIHIRSINGVPVSKVAPLDLDGPKGNDGEEDLSASPLYASDSNGGTEPLDPYAKADEAMKTYMDQDDGGDAWLDMLSGMMEEDEGSEKKADSDTKSDD